MEESTSALQAIPGRSCAACKRRKIRCDRGRPCDYCNRLRLQCVYPGSNHRGNVQAGNDVVSRLRRIESSLERLESSITSAKRPQQPESATTSENENVSRGPPPQPRGSIEDQGQGKLVLTNEGSRFVTSSFWASLDEDDTDSAPQSVYSLPFPEPDLVPSNNNAETNFRRGHIFGSSSIPLDLRQLHPAEGRIFTLWQVFLESVDPIFKLIHVPVTQRQILCAVQNLDNIPPAFESLMFAIYHAAVTSMEYSVSSRTLLHGERKALLDQYAFGFEQALVKADFMSRPDLVTLQALTLYLICARQSADKTYVWSMTGLLVRLANRLGLHQDPARLGLSAFISEMRRRLWWQICILDVRTAEDNDLEPLIYEHAFDTKLPANVNDVDLDVNMTHLGPETPRRTEMLFTIARIEISYAARRLVFSHKFCIDNGYPPLSLQQKNSLIESTLKTLEDKYLKYCDDSIPIYSLTATSTKAVLAKIKLTISYPSFSGSNLSEAHLKDLVTSSIEVIEYAHTLRTNDKYSRWIWLFQRYLEWDAVAFLLHSMSTVGLPTLRERAWRAVNTFWTWQDHVQDEERRWQRLKHLRGRAWAKQALEISHSRVETRASSATEAVRSSHIEAVQVNPIVSSIASESVLPYIGFTDSSSGGVDAQAELEAAKSADTNSTAPTLDQVDWSFDIVSSATERARSWQLDLDSNAFNSWL